jgi:hypothetical protein
MKKKVNKITKRQIAQDKYYNQIEKLTKAFEKEIGKKVEFNYKVVDKK